MSSRTSIQQTISISAPVGAALGDEWLNPTTGVLSKRTIVNGVVDWLTIITNANADIANNEASISTSTGALTVVGGVGIGGDLYVGGRVNASAGIRPRVNSVTIAATTTSLNWTSNLYDQYNLVLANTQSVTILSDIGSPVDGQKILFRIKDDGTVRNIAWSTSGTNYFRIVGTTLPTSTTAAGKLTYVGSLYNASSSTWDVIGVVTES
jgi:hypothetical protein